MTVRLVTLSLRQVLRLLQRLRSGRWNAPRSREWIRHRTAACQLSGSAENMVGTSGIAVFDLYLFASSGFH